MLLVASEGSVQNFRKKRFTKTSEVSASSEGLSESQLGKAVDMLLVSVHSHHVTRSAGWPLSGSLSLSSLSLM